MRQCVVVTGGARGIGRAVAEAFLEKGGCVAVVTDVNGELLRQTEEELTARYGQGSVEAFGLDITDGGSVHALAETIQKKHGGCDVLVNCAGVFRGGPIHQATDEDYDIQFDVNVRGMFHMMRALVPSMLEKGRGAVINISSLSGIRGDYNAPLYCASKAAVIGLTRATAMDYAEKGVRVNCVSPSATETPMFLAGTTGTVMNSFLAALPDHKLGKPEQVAQAVLFLASDAASHIVGQNLSVDGGLSAWNGQPRQNKEEA